MSNTKMKLVVPVITPSSSFSDLTLHLFYSFQECERRLVEDILTNRENDLKDQLRKSKHMLQKMLKEEDGFATLMKNKVDNLVRSRVDFEEKMKEKCDALEKEADLKRRVLEEEVESLRERCEGLKNELDLMEKMVSLASVEKREAEDEMRRQREMLEKEGDLKRSLEDEVESLREKCEELKRERDLMEKTVSLSSLEKTAVEEEMRRQREMFENQNDVLQKGFKKELEKMRVSHNKEMERKHDLMEKKLSFVVLEKVELEEKLKNTIMQNEEARKELEGEFEKAKENYEKYLKRERDLSENKLILANLERMNLEEELQKSRMDFEERIQVLEGKNQELNKKVELHTQNFCNIRDLTEQIKGVYDSAITGNVRANGNGSGAGDVSKVQLL